MSRTVSRVVTAAGLVACLAAADVSAQESTATTREAKSFEVIAVEGNILVVRLPEGTKQLTVPEDFKFTVEGTPMSVHDLKPGMKGTATITTRTTTIPVTVTEVKSGTVMQKSGASVIVKSDEGFKMFTQGALDERGVKIFKDGQEVDLSQLNTGDQLTATIVTAKPPRVMTEKQVNAVVAGGGRATSSPAPTAVASMAAEPAAAPAAAPAPARKLPKTASPLPLVGLVGAASMLLGLALGTLRRRLER